METRTGDIGRQAVPGGSGGSGGDCPDAATANASPVASIRLGAHRTLIGEVPPGTISENVLGSWDPVKNLILIPSGVPTSRRVEVLLHEICHGILTGEMVKNEELVCTLIGEGLARVFRDNPEFVIGIVKSLEENKNE